MSQPSPLEGHAYSSSRTAARGSTEGPRPLAEWEAIAVEAVGNTIDFWRFKRNHGRVWALLYLRAEPMSAQELEDVLRLSKGAVNLVTRELEMWSVIKRVRAPHDSVWRFAPETDFWSMVRRVLEERELRFLGRVRRDLESALAAARRDSQDKAAVERLARMAKLSVVIDRSLRAFLRSAQLDVSSTLHAALGKRLGRRGASL